MLIIKLSKMFGILKPTSLQALGQAGFSFLAPESSMYFFGHVVFWKKALAGKGLCDVRMITL